MIECLRLWNLRSQNAADARDALQHVSSQRLFLSVVLEWQQAKAKAPQSFYHERKPRYQRFEDCFLARPLPSIRYDHSLVEKNESLQSDWSQDTLQYKKVNYIGIYSPRARQKLLSKYMRKREKVHNGSII
ncbi:hypothetical protein ABG067_001383 [Albugo candida]